MEQEKILGINPLLLPHYPYLLQDIWVLGSFPQQIIHMLRPLTLHPGSRVLELGCGKGAVMLQAAKQLGVQVHGVDLYLPFMEEAICRAEEMGVSNLCSFTLQEAGSFMRSSGRYDAVMLAAVGPLFGDYSKAVGILREFIPEGGWIIIDDGFLNDSLDEIFPGYEYYRNYASTISSFEAFGDKVIDERIISPEALQQYNELNNKLIQYRTCQLAALNPALAPILDDFAEQEIAECRFLETQTSAAVWLIEKRGH